MRLLSRSAILRAQASEMRRPAPYAVIRMARCLRDLISRKSCSTSLPVRMSGKVWGRFGQGILATTSGRPNVAA